jgi:PKD repeat protein
MNTKSYKGFLWLLFSPILFLQAMSNPTLPGNTFLICECYFKTTSGSSPYTIHFEGFNKSGYPAVYSWDFGDGNTGNGNTITHSFLSEGTYLVKLHAEDSYGCQSDYEASVGVYFTNEFSLKGMVYQGTQPSASGKIQLFSQTTAGAFHKISETKPDSTHTFTFEQVRSGVYLLVAFPDYTLQSSEKYIPTYYGNEIFWEDASPIALGVASDSYEIHLTGYDSIPGGPCYIYGSLSTLMSSQQVSGVTIIILDQSGNPIRYTSTNESGYFLLQGLPIGTYTVHANLTGFYSTPIQVTLEETAPGSEVNLMIQGNSINGSSESPELNSNISIFPNPVHTILYIKFQRIPQEDTRVEIIGTSGISSTIQSTDCINNEGLLSISTGNLLPGMYILRIIDKKGLVFVKKFSKS